MSLTLHAPTSREPLLLVDDDPLIAAPLAEELRRAGFDVVVASSTSEALELARRTPFALVILDYAMPGRDGLAAAADLLALRRPFMFVSAYGDTSVVDRAVAAGALAYVVKPIDPPQLVPIVRTAVSRAQDIAQLTERAQRIAESMERNRDINVAVGLIMAQRGVARQVAYETVRQHARRTRRRLQDVAEEITKCADLVYGLDVAVVKTGSRTDAEVAT